jgi:hypothetical protein
MIGPFAALIIGVSAVVPAFAQDQATNTDAAQNPGNRGPRPGLAMICVTNNSTDVVAKALGMTAAELRLALVSGKSISDIATSKQIDIKVIQDALAAQRQADLDQALKDGLLTQTEYDTITTMMKNAPTNTNGNTRPGFGLRVAQFNVVDRETVAAKALGMTCAELVKATQNKQTIAEVAASKNVAVQTVIDAVTNAYKEALAQDVKEGLITQAQADSRQTRLTTEIGQWVYSTRPAGPDGRGGQGGPGFGNGQGGRGGQGGPGMGNGQGGNPPNAPQQPGNPPANPPDNQPPATPAGA